MGTEQNQTKPIQPAKIAVLAHAEQCLPFLPVWLMNYFMATAVSTNKL